MVVRNLPATSLWKVEEEKGERLRKGVELQRCHIVYPSETLGGCGEGDDEDNDIESGSPLTVCLDEVH